MSYLLDKKNKRKRIQNLAVGIFLLLFVFYFRAGIFRGLSFVSQVIFRPVIILGNGIKKESSNIFSSLAFKRSLIAENENLKAQLTENQATLANYNSVLDENVQLKDTLGRANSKLNLILSAVLSKPNRSLYDTLLIDVGKNQGAVVNQKVFAQGNVPIGYIAEVYPSSSKVILFSSPGEKTEVVLSGKNAFMEAIGRGGGNFEMILPRDFTVENGTEVSLPGITPYTLAIVQTIISDPRDSYQKALLASPVNIQQLKFVEVEK